MKLKLFLLLVIFSLLNVNQGFAQTIPTCVPQYCGAGWPPPAGEYSTAGLDNCKETCVKMGSVTGYKVIYNKGNNTFHEIIDADMVVIASAYLIFKKAGKEVARFDRAYVLGWKVN